MNKKFFNELLKKYSKIIYFSIFTINIIALFGLSFLYFKANNTIKNIQIEQQEAEKQKKEKEQQANQKNTEENKNEKTEEENFIKYEVKTKKIFENFIFLNENEPISYNYFAKKKTDLKEIEILAKSFYRFFNYDSIKEAVENFKNFSDDIGGMFMPGYQKLTEEQLNKTFKIKDNVKILINQHNLDKTYMIIIFAGEKPNQRFFLFRGYINENGKIRLEEEPDIGNTEELGVK